MFGADRRRIGSRMPAWTADAGIDAHRLPAVLHTAPAAVLIIDPRRRQVVYANPAAIELTGERVRLPVDIDAWSDAAGLTDLGGRRMSETDSPLSLVAAGVPVAGEPVAVHDAARRGSSATPDQREASEGRLLWVTGFGLSDGTALGLDERALVVFLQLTGTEKGERRRLEVLRDRAVVATEMSFTITDPRRADDPLIWVNPAFTRLTGYSLRRGRGPQLQVPAGRRHRPRRHHPHHDGAARAGADHRGAAQLPPRRHGVLEPGVDLPGVRRGGRAGQLRRRAERRHRARARRAGAARGAGRGRGGPRAPAAARRGDHRDDGGARRRRRLHPAGPHRRAAARRPVRRGPARPARRGHRAPGRRGGAGPGRRGAAAPAGAGAPLPGRCRQATTGDGAGGRRAAAAGRAARRRAPTASPTTPRPPPRSTGCACARRSSCRCGPAAGCSAR